MSTKIEFIPIEKRAEVRAKRAMQHRKWRQKDMARYNSKQLAWANKNREKRTIQARKSHLKVRFNLTQDDYEKMLVTQNRMCAICNLVYSVRTDSLGRKTPNLYIDHCHKTGEVRGLLCADCNWILGKAKDSVNLLKSAIKYLK